MNYFGKCTFAYLHVSFARETETNLDFCLSVCLALSLGDVFSALFKGKTGMVSMKPLFSTCVNRL